MFVINILPVSKVTVVPGKGRGIITRRAYAPSEFVCEYVGELITFNDGRRREMEYDQSLGSFLYFFHHNAKGWW